MKVLDPSKIADLLKHQSTGLTHAAPPVEQFGPLRWYDTGMRCASKGCSSPTYCKVEGIPRCSMHSLRRLNEICIEKEINAQTTT